MTHDKRPNNFSERLQRIEDARSTREPVTAAELGIAPEPSPYDRPQEDHTIRNGLIWVVIAVMVAFGGYHAALALPNDLKAVIGLPVDETEMVAAQEPEPEPVAIPEPASYIGAFLPSPAVASLETDQLSLADLASDVALPTPDTMLGEIIPFDRNISCRLRRPQRDENVVNVRLEGGLLPAPLQAISHTALADRLLRNVKAVTQNRLPAQRNGRVTGPFESIDVFLSDTSAPQYVVLQNLGGNILWNLHLAPDVRVAHVALISEGLPAVANLPDGATIEGLHVSDFVEPHRFGADDRIRECMIRPWRKPAPDWVAHQKAAEGNELFRNQLTSFTKGHAAFNAWYTQTLGVDATAHVVAPDKAAHVLVGPRPRVPIRYQPMEGQSVHVMRTDTIIAGDSATRAALTEALHQDMLRAAIGGDLAALDPPVMERSLP
ncbi:hypothetical protein SLH49_04210 [Cognatiyoonia sp. IB215446]|uniref:hypothetical protein n=1 Tax=Cognatiyoonia sp. IB215446 TaxID=3097355 RepID=UPI002A13E5AC|nr:hypothetical protein [Cognatiyoonia sp. IB215446]MDX8347184.1 hypothetical protein [Cognatiyoonia sp. IB215446]